MSTDKGTADKSADEGTADKGTGKDGAANPVTGNPAAAGTGPVELSPKPASQVEGERLGAETDEAMRAADRSREPGNA